MSSLSKITPFHFDHTRLTQVTPHTLPTLHNLFTSITTKLSIQPPLFFILDDDDYINACAFSLAPNMGIVIIGKQLALNLTLGSLVSVLAHECGHVKEWHVSKNMILGTLMHYSLRSLISYPFDKKGIGIKTLIYFTSLFITLRILFGPISRYFERQADNIALSIMRNPEWLARSFKEIDVIVARVNEKKQKNCAKIINLLKDLYNKEDAHLLLEKLINQKKSVLQKLKEAFRSTFFSSTHPSDTERAETTGSTTKN